jgi:hypothetical protein
MNETTSRPAVCRVPLPEEVLTRFARKEPARSGPFRSTGPKLYFWPTNGKPVLIGRWLFSSLYVRDVDVDGWLMGSGLWTPQDALGRLESYLPTTLVRVNGSPYPWRCVCTRLSSFWSALREPEQNS